MKRNTGKWLISLALLSAGACTTDSPQTPVGPEDGVFESAGSAGSRGSAEDSAGGRSDAGAAAPSGDGAEREVVEADLYRFEGNRLYVLNQYRGLFVFDVTDPARPVEIGRMPLTGYPVEMYVRGSRAYAIISDYFSYWRDDSLDETALAPVYGSRIVGIDLTDATAPRQIGDVFLDGYVADTRLVGDVIYAVSNRYSWWGTYGSEDSVGRDETVLTSIDIADPTAMREVDQETFDTNGWFVHATSDAFVIAGNVWDTGWTEQKTRIQLVDISDPNGALTLGGSRDLSGGIQDDSALNVYGDQIRVITRDWSDQTTRLRILNAAEPATLPVLGELEYEYVGSLFGTQFDGERAYMIHFETIDPLEVMDLSDPTAPVITGILEMPGFVERIAPLGNHLIGLGRDNTSGEQITLSLFDVTDPAEPRLLDRVESGGGSWAWSSASWERKAWTVDAEAGVVLFPYSSYSYEEGSYESRHALGIVQFTDAELIPRGEVLAPAPVERGAVRNDYVYALSQSALQVVSIRSLEVPVATATVELARNVSGYARTSRVGVELVSSGLEWYDSSEPNRLRLTDLSAPDGAAQLGTLTLPRRADGLFTYGDLAVAIRAQSYCGYYDGAGCTGAAANGIAVVNVADPARPSLVANLDLPADPETSTTVGDGNVYSSSYWQQRYNMPVGGWSGGDPALALGGGRFALLRTKSISCNGEAACASVDIEPTVYEYEDYPCGYYEGGGASDGGAGEPTPEPRDEPGAADAGPAGDAPECERRTVRSYYGNATENEVAILDLSNPAAPALLETIDIGRGVVQNLFASNGLLVYSFATPSRTDADGRSWVRYYMRRVQIDAAGIAHELPTINVPGVILALSDDGSRGFTLDSKWETVTESSGMDTPYTYTTMARYLAAITLSDTLATRVSELRLGFEGASSVAIAGDYAYLLANPTYGYYYGGGDVAVGAPRDTDESSTSPRLKVIALADPSNLEFVHSQRLGSGYSWWQLASVGDGKLVLSGGYGGGLAIFDLATPAAPLFKSYAATNGYAVSILRTASDLYLSGGPYGIQKVSLE